VKLFIDGADSREIRDAAARGIIDGVTTTPSLLAEAIGASGRRPSDLLEEICRIVKGPVAAAVAAAAADEMLREGRELAEIAPNIVVRLPFSTEGLEVVGALAGEGVRTNVTLCANPADAVRAARAGASYVSPVWGRAGETAADRLDLARKLVAILRSYDLRAEVLVDSVRNPDQLVDAALAGAAIASVPHAVLQQLVKHPLTDAGLRKSSDDWNRVGR
jgi:transaldolase